MTDTIKRIEDALEEVEACLKDDEDGQGYLWDFMRSNNITQAALETILEMHRGDTDGLWLDDLDKSVILKAIEEKINDT